MCKTLSLAQRLRVTSYLCFFVFGFLGGAFQLDFIAHQDTCQSNAAAFNDTNVPNC